MAIVFEKILSLGKKEQPYICHEKTSELFQYYIDNKQEIDAHSPTNLGTYEDIVFKDPQHSITTRSVSSIGVKNFPEIGGIGFYKNAYSDESKILAPIHLYDEKREAPTLVKAEIVDGLFHVVITPPQNIKYDCYRIVCLQEPFATEFITYKEDYVMDAPPVKGSYKIYCIGYDEQMGTVSEESNELNLNITTGAEDWSPWFFDPTDLTTRVTNLETEVGNVGSVLDDINGEVI